MNIGDIVQIDPEMETFGGCMATVTEVKHNGRIMAYVQSAGVPGQQYIFLNAGKYEPTGGRAVWVAGGAATHADGGPAGRAARHRPRRIGG